VRRGEERRGKNSFYKLQEKTANNLTGVGCSTHNVHNAVQIASDCLPPDIQSITVKICQHIHIYGVCVEAPKSCEFTETEYTTILAHSKTRRLALLPNIEKTTDFF
jgi:hypothetical protein